MTELKDDFSKNYEEKIDDILAMLNCIKIVSDIDKFQNWLRKEHNIEDHNDIFEGYAFFIECSMRCVFHEILLNSSLKLKEDYTFYNARHEGILLNKIPNTCEKLIFLKNLNVFLKDIKKCLRISFLFMMLISIKAKIIYR